MTSLAHRYLYVEPSNVVSTARGAELRLATCGVHGEHPHFFRGRMVQPRLVADLLLVLMQVVRTHFWQPRPAQLDPVVTASEPCLRFEGFSGCCGVYARVDLQASAFDAEIGGRGTTNVDFNEPMRTALARLRDDEQVGLAVGRDGVELERRDEGDTVVEKRVRLPVRWVKGFSEVQAYQPGLTPFQALDGGAARQFLRALPRQASGALHLARSGKAIRVTPVASRDTARAGGLQRLRVLDPLLSRIDSLRVWSDPASGTSGWEAGFANARLFLLLSPDTQRGFSGEGQALSTLAAGHGDAALARVRAELRWQAELDPMQLAGKTGLANADVTAALTALGTRGLAGFDVHSQRYFHRELPFDIDRIEALQPRLLDARALVQEGKVAATTLSGSARDEAGYTVAGTNTTHLVRLAAEGDRCSCPWFSRHQGERGPCKHILAARITADGE
jgi:hypothetical protein